MRITKSKLLIILASINAFILTSTLYSSIDFVVYITFAIHFSILIFIGEFNKLRKTEFNFSLFLICILLSLVGSIDLSASLTPSFYIFYIMMFSLVLSKSITNIVDVERFLYFAMLGLIVFNLRNFLFSQDSQYRFEGVAGQSNALGLISGTGLMLGIAYLALFNSKYTSYTKITSITLILTSLILVILSGSRGAIVSVLLASIYFLARNFKYNFKIVVSLIVSLLMIIVFYWNKIIQLPIYSRILAIPSALGLENYGPEIDRKYKSAGDDIRLDIAESALEGFYDRPVFGNGLNTFNYYSDFNYTHSTHLEILFTLGLFGTVYFYILLLSAFRATNNTKSYYYTKLTTTKDTIIVYFILAGISIPNYQNKSQVIIYAFLIISVNLISKNNLYYYSLQKQKQKQK